MLRYLCLATHNHIWRADPAPDFEDVRWLMKLYIVFGWDEGIMVHSFQEQWETMPSVTFVKSTCHR